MKNQHEDWYEYNYILRIYQRITAGEKDLQLDTDVIRGYRASYSASYEERQAIGQLVLDGPESLCEENESSSSCEETGN